jgi:hypothetical protein
MGKPARLWDDLSCGDLGLAANLPPNNATLLRPAIQETLDGVLERVEDFFASGEGGGYEIWSLWPLPDEMPPGYEEWPCPCMVLEHGGDPPSPPHELEIVEADDEATVLEAEALIDGSPDARVAWSLLRVSAPPRTPGGVGRVDGRPVTTATAYVADGFVAFTPWPPPTSLGDTATGTVT